MVVEKIYVNNATRLTLSDRFTILQSVQPGLPPRRPRIQNPFEDGQTSTLRSSSIMNRLGLTPMARAAMEIKKVPLKQRIGKIRPRAPNSQSLFRNGAPLMSPGRGRGRGAQRRSRSFSSIARGRRRSNSIGNLNRSSSFSDVSSGAENQVYDRPLRVRRRGRGGFRFHGQTRNTSMQRGGVRRWKSGRGGGRGRGRGRGSGRGNGNRGGSSVPSKEDLDRELDQYMAGTKAHLDQELDSYMVNAMDTSN